MKASLLRSYKSKNGNVVFVYKVTGKAADLATFQEAQGEFYVEDPTNGPLWFTTKCVGQECPLLITTNGRVCADTSAFDQAASLAAQYGGNLGQELAKHAAAMLLGNKPITTPVNALEPVEATDPNEL